MAQPVGSSQSRKIGREADLSLPHPERRLQPAAAARLRRGDVQRSSRPRETCVVAAPAGTVASRPQVRHAGWAMRELPHTRSCFVCGESNPLGLKLRFHTDGEQVRAMFTPQTEHIGFRAVTHGGLLSTVLDEVMVWACAVRTKRFAYCAEMTVRFLRHASPGVVLTAVGRLVEDRRGRLFQASGELLDPAGRVIATSTGKYLPIPDEEAQGMAEDFIGGSPIL